jgi:hypothetical protein
MRREQRRRCDWRWPAGRAFRPALRASLGLVASAPITITRVMQYGVVTAIALSFFASACIARSEDPRKPLAQIADVTHLDSRRDVCTALTDGVRVRIEELKTMSRDWSAKIRSGQGDDASDKMRDEHRTIKDLNDMLQGIGCKSLNIEYEISQPPRRLPPAPAAKLKFGR